MTRLKFLKKILLIIFLITSFYPNNSFAQSKYETQRRYIKLQVDGLACPFCAYGLEKKLKAINGAEGFFIDIKNGSAFLDVPESTKISKVEFKKIVSDAGFSLKDIEIADKPFKEKKDEEEDSK